MDGKVKRGGGGKRGKRAKRKCIYYSNVSFSCLIQWFFLSFFLLRWKKNNGEGRRNEKGKEEEED